MNAVRQAMIVGLVAFGSLIAKPCHGQEPADTPTTEELQREITELSATVAELTKRLEWLEYQKMPRAEMKTPQLAPPRIPAPSYSWPTVLPARFPVEVHDVPMAIPSPKRTLPAYLRFPEEVERAMMGPFLAIRIKLHEALASDLMSYGDSRCGS